MKVTIGTDYISIDDKLYPFSIFNDLSTYVILYLINEFDETRYRGPLSRDRKEEVVTDEKIFMTPYGRTILEILYSYYDFKNDDYSKEEYEQLRKIKNNLQNNLKEKKMNKIEQLNEIYYEFEKEERFKKLMINDGNFDFELPDIYAEYVANRPNILKASKSDSEISQIDIEVSKWIERAMILSYNYYKLSDEEKQEVLDSFEKVLDKVEEL